MLHKAYYLTLIILILLIGANTYGQINWTQDGNSYYKIVENEIVKTSLPEGKERVFISKEKLTTTQGNTLKVRDFSLSTDGSKMLIYTNTRKVWRIDTEGDYWVLNLKTGELNQVGSTLTESSLRFAKLSPDGTKAAYVSEFNVYVEDLNSHEITQLTNDGDRKLINGTFDWAYEEEFACRDGFQWSPDGKRIAFWQIDARQIRDYYMINNTDSVYSKIIPVEYPTSGQTPSPAKIGVIDLASNKTQWLNIAGDPSQHYIPRIEWNSPSELFVQQLNRKQNNSKIINCNVISNTTKLIFEEHDDAWIDVLSVWENTYGLTYRHQFKWVNDRQEFLWTTEKDGWKHIYRIDKEGKEKLVTKGSFDVMDVLLVHEGLNKIYYYASPDNATQKYLYVSNLDGSGISKRVTPQDYPGTHSYSISPNAKYAYHSYQNHHTKPISEYISLPDHRPINKESIVSKLKDAQIETNVEFLTIKTEDGTEMDAWMVKPTNFDPSKKYPIVFMVYTEPWGANVKDRYGVGNNRLYRGDMADDGYIYMTIDNRGTPAPKGSQWRKCIYRKIGKLNISDQAMAAREILKWDFVDPDRVAVWGWSGGGSATLNLMFQYPEIYKTGIAVAAVANQLTYDNIYQERYMGLPQENIEDFIDGSPITHAKNLEGNLLYIHGTGDDNVHYNNAEMLINELIKHNKQFQLMAYPNRSHSISEGEGTFEHLSTLYTNYLKLHCPGGGR